MEVAAGEVVGKAALRAGMHRNTGRRHLSSGRLPGEPPPARTCRTRPDPFAEVWAEPEQRLLEAPGLEARALLWEQIEREPCRYGWGHLRTLQRRVRRWWAAHGPKREVFFAQEHRPGEALQMDFTWASELEVTIRGERYPDMLWYSPRRRRSALGYKSPAVFEALAASTATQSVSP